MHLCKLLWLLVDDLVIVSFLFCFLFNKLSRNHAVTVRNDVVVYYLNLSDESKVGQCKKQTADCRPW